MKEVSQYASLTNDLQNIVDKLMYIDHMKKEEHEIEPKINVVDIILDSHYFVYKYI